MDTLRLTADTRDVVARAAELLKSGQVIAVPTETVYGLAADSANPEAIARLRALKTRDADKPFSIAVADPERALARLAAVTPAARRLAKRYWPGPLTLVADDVRGGSIGLRVPGHELTRDILRAADVEAALPSANPAGETPANDADAVHAWFGGRIAAIVDGGEAAIGEPSTVVLATPERIAVLRRGFLTEQDVFRTAVRRILFVCSGNTCRSPMAAAAFRDGMARRFGVTPDRLPVLGYEVGSAGVAAGPGIPASEGAVRAMASRGIDIRSHRSRTLTRPMIDEQDLILCLTGAHYAAVAGVAAEPSRVRRLDPNGGDVVDPFGASDAVYEECAAEIEQYVNYWLERT